MSNNRRNNNTVTENVAYGSSAMTSPTTMSSSVGAFGNKSNLYRDGSSSRQPQNIMYDRRVVRGSTIAAPVLPPSAIAEIERRERENEDRGRRRMEESRKRAIESRRERTPEPVPGRAHADLQTETYLEVLSDRLPEEEMGVQTDALMDRPPSPLFVPRPSGVDAVTQIDPNDNDLFDFDYEVEPLLEVLIGKTLESAVLELAQELELSAIRARQQEYLQVRNAELAEVQRLEAEVKRRQAEKARRLQQEKDRVAREVDLQQKVAATAFSRSYLVAMRNRMMENLRRKGYFYDPLRKEIETLLMPEILEALGNTIVNRETVARTLADDVLSNVLNESINKFQEHQAKLKADKEAAEAALLAATEEARRQKEERIARRKAEQEEAAKAAAEGEENQGDNDE